MPRRISCHGGLGRGKGIATRRLEGRTSFGQLSPGNQNVGPAVFRSIRTRAPVLGNATLRSAPLTTSAVSMSAPPFPQDETGMRSSVGTRMVDPNEAIGVTVLCVVTYGAHPNGPTLVTPRLVQENSLTWITAVPGEHQVQLIHLIDAAIQPT